MLKWANFSSDLQWVLEPGRNWHFSFQVTQSVLVSHNNNTPVSDSIYKHSVSSSWGNGLHFPCLKHKEGATSDMLTVSWKDFPFAWQWSFCTPWGSTDTIWDSRNSNYFWLLWWGEDGIVRYQFKKKQTIKEGAFLFELCVPSASVQQSFGHRLLLPVVPQPPQDPATSPLAPPLPVQCCWPWARDSCRTGCAVHSPLPRLGSRCPPGAPDRQGLKIKTNGRLRTFYNHRLSSCVALTEGCAVRT